MINFILNNKFPAAQQMLAIDKKDTEEYRQSNLINSNNTKLNFKNAEVLKRIFSKKNSFFKKSGTEEQQLVKCSYKQKIEDLDTYGWNSLKWWGKKIMTLGIYSSEKPIKLCQDLTQAETQRFLREKLMYVQYIQ